MEFNFIHVRSRLNYVIICIAIMIFGISIPVSALGSGTLDTLFHPNDGYTIYQSGNNSTQDHGVEMVVQKTGKIVVAGYTNTSGNKDILVTRFSPDGLPDLYFGKDGKIIVSGPVPKDDYAFGLDSDSNENLVVTGRMNTGNSTEIVVIRFTKDGQPDTSFGREGVLIYKTPFGGTNTGRAVKTLSDGSMIITGETNRSANKDLFILKLKKNGEVDKTFGTGTDKGIVIYDGIKNRDDFGFGLATNSDGSMFVTGGATDNEKGKIVLMKLDKNGNFDGKFGDKGIVLYSGDGKEPDYGNWVVVQKDGKPVVAGVVSNKTGSYDIVLLRYTKEGKLDTTFGKNGTVIYGTPGKYDYAWNVEVEGDGALIVAGTITVDGKEIPALLKFTKDGILDKSFGKDGVASFPKLGVGSLFAVKFTKAGQVLSTGFVKQNGTEKLLLMQVNR